MFGCVAHDVPRSSDPKDLWRLTMTALDRAPVSAPWHAPGRKAYLRRD